MIERQLNRTRRLGRRIDVADTIVEEFEIELLDAGLDRQMIDVGQFADDANGAAGDRIRKRR